MNIFDKFQKGIENRTFQRIDPSYKVNIFLGYNENGNMSMIITEPGKEEITRSSKYIDVGMKRRNDGKLALSFDLLDKAFAPMFIIFCHDMISVCEKAGRENAIASGVQRWKYWRELFGRSNCGVLSRLELKGLLGELLFLKEYMIPRYGLEKSIHSWMGPACGHKDFEIQDTWYEVKTVSQGALQVSISSIEQLEAQNQGHLIVERIEETSTNNSEAVTLNSTVMDLARLIGDDPFILEIFRDKLSAVGYFGEAEYDNYCFINYGCEMYRVGEAFPRIRRSDIHECIGNAQYTILLNGLNDFKEA